jgi:hypothetical protein
MSDRIRAREKGEQKAFVFVFGPYYERRTRRRTYVACEVSWSVGGRGGQADGTDGVDGRAMPGPRSWMALIEADTQSGQINFTARRNNVIG